MTPEMKHAFDAFDAIYTSLDARLTRMEARVAEMTEIFGDEDTLGELHQESAHDLL